LSSSDAPAAFDLESTSEAPAGAAPEASTGHVGEADDALELSDIQFDDESESAEPATPGNGDAAAGEAVAGGAAGAGAEAPSDGAALDAGDLDLSDLEAESGPDEAEAPAEFDLGELDTGADAAGEVEAAPVSEAPAAESEIGAGEEGEEDDFDTMIDLARAYIDMGDAESAATTLDEVANAGTEKQKSEALELLASVR
jgi:pilus assembly protein FimV